MLCKERNEITFPFPNFKGIAVEVWEWISNLHPSHSQAYYLKGDGIWQSSWKDYPHCVFGTVGPFNIFDKYINIHEIFSLYNEVRWN